MVYSENNLFIFKRNPEDSGPLGSSEPPRCCSAWYLHPGDLSEGAEAGETLGSDAEDKKHLS